MLINLKSYHEVDPAKKDYEWANVVVQHLRQYLRPIVGAERYNRNMQILRGDFAVDKLRKLFKDPDNSGVAFVPLNVMEKLRLIMIAENENAGIHINLRANDPTAVNQSQYDKELLANRKMIEAHIGYMAQTIGLPPFKVADQKSEKGKSIFNGDVETFDKMGLDDNSQEDVDYFWSTFYRLRHEIGAEDIVNHIIKFNEVSEMIGPMVNDILAVKRVAFQAYVDEMDGPIRYKYINPTNVKAIRCKRRDFKDSKAMSVEEPMSVGEFIKMVGNEFDYNRDMPSVLQAANATNSTSYTCVIDERGYKYFGEWGTGLEYSNFLEMQILVGYMEWKSIDADTYKVTTNNAQGNVSLYPTDPARQLSKDSKMSIESWYNEVTYKAYYLAQTATTQKLYRFGKLNYPELEGAEDEYSNFSICAYAEWGKPAAQIAEPFIEMIQTAWIKFQHIVAAAKPPGRAYNYESLLKIATAMFPEQGVQVGIDSVMKMFMDGINEIWSIPTTDDDKPIGGSGQSSFELPNGLSKSALEFKTILDYNFGMIDDQLGISTLRQAGTPDPRDGYKLSMQALQYSHNATQYIRSMLMNVINNLAKRTLIFVQEIVRFREHSSRAYKTLLKAIGDEAMTDIDTLGDVPLHRYGIFVEALNTQYEKEMVKQHAQQALANKEIDYKQFLLILSARSYKRALQIMGYEQVRKKRDDVQQQQMANEHAMAMAKQQTEERVAIETTKGGFIVQAADVTGQWNFKIAELQVKGIIDKQVAKNDAEPGIIDQRSQAKIAEREAAADAEAQKPLIS